MHKINVVDMPNYKPVVMGSKKLSGSVKYQHNFFATNINFEKVARDHVHSLFVNFRYIFYTILLFLQTEIKI